MIISGEDTWEWINDTHIRVLSCSPHLASYLDINQEYPIKRHECGDVWEIDVCCTKRPDSISQILLYLWEDGYSIEVDS